LRNDSKYTDTVIPGLPGPKIFKGANLAISNFKKGQILKNEKRPNKGEIYYLLKQEKKI